LGEKGALPSSPISLPPILSFFTSSPKGELVFFHLAQPVFLGTVRKDRELLFKDKIDLNIKKYKELCSLDTIFFVYLITIPKVV
jgi:hypothetical protein